MSATVETQRLISVSLGKIAQSRGQRGGINLHKNLLVATVLHKARAAYMIETFNYQQQHQMSLQQQKLHDEQMLRLHQQQHHHQQQHAVHQEPASPIEQVCEASHESDLGQCSLASAAAEGSTQESQIFVSSAPLCEESSPEPFVGQQCEQVSHSETPEHILAPSCEYISPEPVMSQECELSVSLDKENSVPDIVSSSQCIQNDSKLSDCDHLQAANKLSQEASMGLNCVSSSDNYSSCQLQSPSPPVMSGSPTCTGILKRRRDNCNSQTSDGGSSVCKKPRTIFEPSASSVTKSSPFFATFTSEASDYSSEESESDSDSCVVPMNTDTTQISNLVNIFNSGFSGLCAGELAASQESDYDCDFESTAPPQYTTLTQLRPESAMSNKTFSRSMSEPSLMCSTEVGRLDSLPSAIVLSA